MRLLACPPAGPYEPEADHLRREAVGRPVILSDVRQGRGQVVSNRHGHACHQRGEGGPGPSLLRLAPGPIMRTQIRVSPDLMRGFSRCKFSPDDKDPLVAYLKARASRAASAPTWGVGYVSVQPEIPSRLAGPAA